MRDEPEIRAREDDGFLLVRFSFLRKAGDRVEEFRTHARVWISAKAARPVVNQVRIKIRRVNF
jgi:hypothetical protein